MVGRIVRSGRDRYFIGSQKNWPDLVQNQMSQCQIPLKMLHNSSESIVNTI